LDFPLLGGRCCCGLQTPAAARAQEAPSHFGIGFVANAPDQLTGISGHILPRGFFGFGIYVDAKRSVGSPRNRRGFTEEFTVAQIECEFEDQFFRTDAFSQSINGALVRGMGRDLLLYGGAGIVQRHLYHEYLDRAGVRGIGGVYTVRDGEASGSVGNVLGGAFLRLGSRIWIQAGAESMPRGATIGGSLIIPLK